MAWEGERGGFYFRLSYRATINAFVSLHYSSTDADADADKGASASAGAGAYLAITPRPCICTLGAALAREQQVLQQVTLYGCYDAARAAFVLHQCCRLCRAELKSLCPAPGMA